MERLERYLKRNSVPHERKGNFIFIRYREFKGNTSKYIVNKYKWGYRCNYEWIIVEEVA